MLYFAAILLIGIGFAHSYLGERYLLKPLFQNGRLPRLFGGTEFSKNTLRFAWHLTTVAWFGFAGILVYLSDNSDPYGVIAIIGATFFIHFAVALTASRGKHYSWIVFLAISAISFGIVF
ncbi:MAG: hypothetical protein AAF353_00175 [Pseudomonadota bacterium]